MPRTVLLLLPLTTALLAACAPRQPAHEAPGERPNIIFLLTDDHRADALGVAGHPVIRTPQIDALARDGVRFRNAYVTTPICMISRASYFSGQYERSHGIHDFATPFSAEALAQTYPALLRQAGYWSGFIGKYGVGNRMPVDGFDVWHGFPGQGRYETEDAAGRPIHLTRLMGQQAVEFVRAAPADRPFVLSISFKAPHVQDEDPRQFIPDPAYAALYRDADIPPPPSAGTRDRLPAFLREEQTESRLRWHKRFATPEMHRESVKNYYRLISGVDEVIAEIRAALRARGVEEKTVIVFAGDNGFFLGEHDLAGKWYAYEESIRVPLIVYDPRLPPRLRGRVRDEIALNIDVAPTLLEVAGVPIPSRVQGRSLVPLVRGEEPRDWREDFLFEHLFVHPRIPRSDGVVTLRYKYLRYIDQEPAYEQLFDLATDPLELENLVGSPAHADVLRRMRERYAALVAEAADPASQVTRRQDQSASSLTPASSSASP